MLTKNECIDGMYQRLLQYCTCETKYLYQLKIDLEAIYEQGKMQAEKDILCNTQEWWAEQDVDQAWVDAHGEGGGK